MRTARFALFSLALTIPSQVQPLAQASQVSARKNVPSFGGISSDALSLRAMSTQAQLIFVGVIGKTSLHERQDSSHEPYLQVEIDIPRLLFLKGRPSTGSSLLRREPDVGSAPIIAAPALNAFGPIIPISLDLSLPTAGLVEQGHVVFWFLDQTEQTLWQTAGYYSGFFTVETTEVNGQHWCTASNMLGNGLLWNGKGDLWSTPGRVDPSGERFEERVKRLLRADLEYRRGLPPQLVATKLSEWIARGSRADSRGSLPLDLLVASVMAILNPMQN
jgi:hypothetical protein